MLDLYPVIFSLYKSSDFHILIEVYRNVDPIFNVNAGINRDGMYADF